MMRRAAQAAALAGRARTRAPGRAAFQRNPQPVKAQRRLLDHGPRTEEAPVEQRAAEPFEVDTVRPIGRLHLRQFDAPATRSYKVEQRCACQKPTDRPRRVQQFHARDNAVDQVDEAFAFADMTGAGDSTRHVR